MDGDHPSSPASRALMEVRKRPVDDEQALAVASASTPAAYWTAESSAAPSEMEEPTVEVGEEETPTRLQRKLGTTPKHIDG